MSPTSMSADILREVTAARQGDREALGRVLDLMRPYLLAVGKDRGQRLARAESEDLVQEAICNAVRAFGQFEGTTAEELRGWLRRILLNAVRDRHKHWGAERRHPRREVAADDGTLLKEQLTAQSAAPLADLIREEKISAIQLALAELKDEHRSVIALRCRDGLSFADVGSRLGRTKEAARKLWERALVDLKARLQSMRQEDSDFQDRCTRHK